MHIDWAALRAAATEAMRRAYAPYSGFPVGAAGLVDDGRTVVGCNVENASYGVTLCAECGVVSALCASGGGRLVALSCVDGTGAPLMPCGRCRQLLWEHGGPECLVDAPGAALRMADLLPYAFGPDNLTATATAGSATAGGVADPAGPVRGLTVPPRLAQFQGRGMVFVHPDMVGGAAVWTAYWERSGGDAEDRPGILEEGPTWPSAADAVHWGRARTPRIVVVAADGATYWAGEGDPPPEVGSRWVP